MRLRHALWLGSLSLPLLLVGACADALGIDDLAFDLSSATGSGGSGGGSVGGMTSSGGNGSGAGGSSSGGGSGSGGDLGPAANGLEIVGSVMSGTLSLQTQDLFRLTWQESKKWQLVGWTDLASDPTTPVGASGQGTSGLFFNPFDHRYNSTWYGGDAAVGGTVATLVDETPVRVLLYTDLEYAPANTGFAIDADYAVWANGYVGTRVEFRNEASVQRDLGGLEPNHTTVSNAHSWTRHESLGSPKAMAFVRTDGSGAQANLLKIYHGNETAASEDNIYNHFWSAGAQQLAPNASIARAGVLVVAPSGQSQAELTTRADDTRNASALQIMGGMLIGDGYDEPRAVYQVQAAASTVAITIDGNQKRHSPRFEVHGFNAARWSISLGGELLAHDGQPAGPKLLARMTQDYLVFIYLDDIDTADADRTFVISEN